MRKCKRYVAVKPKLEVKDSVVVKNTQLITPPYLQKGDTIAIVAPAGILTNRKDVIDKAKALAESWGLHVVYGKHLFDKRDIFLLQMKKEQKIFKRH